MTLKSIGKLRKYASEVVKSPQYIGGETFDLMAIADEIEREIAERYMELPVDADGVPIRVADHMEYMGDEIVVAAITPTRAYYWVPNNGYDSEMTYKDGEKLHRYKPRTIEDVLRDLLNEPEAESVFESEHEKIIAKYADELRGMGVSDD